LIISFNAYRGGNGKTTLGINLAYALARLGQKILLMDLDDGAPALQDYLWDLIPPDRKPRRFYTDYLILEKGQGKVEFADCIASVEVKGVKFDVVFLAPKGAVNPHKLVALQRKQFGLLSEEYRKLAGAFEYAEEHGYKHVLVDSSCGYDVCNLMLVASVSEMIILVARAHKIDLQETIVYNFLALGGLLREKKKTYPLSHTQLKILVNEVADERFLEVILGDILETNKIPSDRVEGAILEKIRYYPEIRLDRDPVIFSASNPNHPYTEKMTGIAKQIIDLAANKPM
jgi:cellulose biosynthesis protein BcsQ